MAIRDTQDVLIIEQPFTSGHLRATQDVLIFEVPAPYGTATLNYMFVYVPVGAGAPVGFTPVFPPVGKQPFGMWGLEAARGDSVTVDGIKRSVLDRLIGLTTLTFPAVALSDMPQWKAFQAYALTGGQFLYCPLPDYPGSSGTSNQFSLVQIISMDWTPKFECFQTFSLEMKLKLIGDM